VEPAQTPMSALASNEIKLGATEFARNVDSFPAPKGALGVADGLAASTANVVNAISAVRKIGNVAQAFREQYGAGWIMQAGIPEVAGVGDVIAYGKMKAAVQIKRHIEVAMCSTDQIAAVDAGSNLGAVGAGYHKLVASANAYAATGGYQVGKATDLHFAPVSAVVSGTMTATHSRSMWKTVALELRKAAQMNGDWTLLAGLTLRQAVTDLTNPEGTSVTAVASAANSGYGLARSSDQVRVLLRSESDNTLGASVDVIQTDFGRFIVATTDYIGTTTTVSAALTSWATVSADRVAAAFVSQPRAGLIIKRGNVFKRWGVPVNSVKLGETGGGDTYDTKCLVAWGVKNPALAGVINFTA
jgi:hypothetical protein